MRILKYLTIIFLFSTLSFAAEKDIVILSETATSEYSESNITSTPDSLLYFDSNGDLATRDVATVGSGTQVFANVTAYGATPDDGLDDVPGIQAAIDACLISGDVLVFPQGTYDLQTFHTDSGVTQDHLRANGNASFTPNVGLKIVGMGEVILKSTYQDAAMTMLRLYRSSDRALIKNIRFLHPGGADADSRVAITITGSSASNNNRDTVIEECTFDGFSSAISAVANKNLTIQDCKFYNSKGRDSGFGTLNSAPQVGVRFFCSVGSGQSINVNVLNNFFSGYSGENGIATDAPQSGDCADGFLYGQIDGGLISGNVIEKFQYEGIYFGIWDQAQGEMSGPIIIQNNSLQANYPETINHSASWGIRCDSDNTYIMENKITEIGKGISCNAGQAIVSNIVIKGNTIIHSKGNRGNWPSIKVSSESNSLRYHAPVISDNLIIHDFTGIDQEPVEILANIKLANVDNAIVINNTCINKNWDNNATETLSAFSVTFGANNLFQHNHVFNSESLVRHAGNSNVPTDVILKYNLWEGVSIIEDLNSDNTWSTYDLIQEFNYLLESGDLLMGSYTNSF